MQSTHSCLSGVFILVQYRLCSLSHKIRAVRLKKITMKINERVLLPPKGHV